MHPCRPSHTVLGPHTHSFTSPALSSQHSSLLVHQPPTGSQDSQGILHYLDVMLFSEPISAIPYFQNLSSVPSEIHGPVSSRCSYLPSLLQNVLLTQGHCFPAGVSGVSHAASLVPHSAAPGDEGGFLLDSPMPLQMTFLLLKSSNSELYAVTQ